MGRKKLGNVLFARRLSPAQVEGVTRFLEGGLQAIPANPRPFEGEGVSGPSETAKGEIKALLENIDVLTKEAEELRGHLEAARGNVEGNGVYWRERCLRAEGRVRELEA